MKKIDFFFHFSQKSIGLIFFVFREKSKYEKNASHTSARANAAMIIFKGTSNGFGVGILLSDLQDFLGSAASCFFSSTTLNRSFIRAWKKGKKNTIKNLNG